MRRIALPNTGIETSRFIFGTAGLFNSGDARARARLLDAAADHGLSHFDTAPYYGFGMAERDLAPLLARRRELTVTTKVGIYSPGGEAQPAGLILARKAAGRLVHAVSRPTIDWGVARARGALDASLRRLGRDHVELYLLHEPDLALLDEEAWLDWLEREVRDGRIGRFGLAIDAARLPSFVAAKSPFLRFVQTIDSLDGREADTLTDAGHPLQITYGYVSDALRRHGTADVPAILGAALARNRTGAVIVSTRRPERLAQYAAIAEREPG